MPDITLETIYAELVDFRARTEEKLKTNDEQHEEIIKDIKGISDTLSGKSNGNGLPYTVVTRFVKNMDNEQNLQGIKFAVALKKYLTSIFIYISCTGLVAVAGVLLYLWSKHQP